MTRTQRNRLSRARKANRDARARARWAGIRTQILYEGQPLPKGFELKPGAVICPIPKLHGIVEIVAK